MNNCRYCQSNLEKFEKEYHDIFICWNCYIINYSDSDDCCKNPEHQHVIYLTRSGGTQVRKQCRSCGELIGTAFSKKDFNITKLPNADIAKRDRVKNLKNQEYREINEMLKERKRVDFFDDHNNYLNTPEWKEKRELVLKRDQHICQSCLKEKATQVHHLSYKYNQNEPLFELISVCKRCHEIITNMDRGEPTASIH